MVTVWTEEQADKVYSNFQNVFLKVMELLHKQCFDSRSSDALNGMKNMLSAW